MKITVAGVGYVGLSLAVLLAQNHDVTAITTTESKAEMLNQFISPIQDDEIERFFKEVREGERTLNLFTTTDKEAAYGDADLVIIATPTNYDDVNHFCSVGIGNIFGFQCYIIVKGIYRLVAFGTQGFHHNSDEVVVFHRNCFREEVTGKLVMNM